MLIPFPMAFGTAVVFTDVAYWVSDARAWAVASAWLLWAAFATGVLAAAAGATAVVLVVTGYLGGELSYRHMIGANPGASKPESPTVGSQRNDEH